MDFLGNVLTFFLTQNKSLKPSKTQRTKAFYPSIRSRYEVAELLR